MLYPSINLLKTKVDSRYTLVIMAAKRARDLVEGKPKLTLMESNKPVSVATYEISDDLISYKRQQETACDDDESEVE
ncbi:MAG TPA: DNA-directed RNA polymerase subunit omega [Clostridiales bacterium]|jgi:DNA-directed RNA polymerase subunit omega|nr:DNA-directed RNA polymerase subunit omega [Clostridiales bacterium]